MRLKPAANVPKDPDEQDLNSPEWDEIKKFVGSAKPQPRNAVADAIKTHAAGKKPLRMDEGGLVPGEFDVSGGDSTTVRGPQAPITPQEKIAALEEGGPDALTPPTVPVAPPIPGQRQQPVPGAPPAPPPGPPSLAPPYKEAAAGVLGGITPEAINRLEQNLSAQSRKAQIPAAIAGLGDAIASVGGRTPGAMKGAEDIIGQRREAASKLPLTMAEVGKQQYGLAKELQADDPNSPLSKAAQRTYGPLLKTLGFTDAEIPGMPLSIISDATAKGADIGKIRAEMKMKGIELGLKGKELEETGRHNAATEKTETGRTQETGLESLAKMPWYSRILHPGVSGGLEKAAGLSTMNAPAPAPVITNQAEFDALPKGAHFLDAEGKVKVKN